MKQKNRCWVELDSRFQLPIRIFRNHKDAIKSVYYDEGRITEFSKKEAVRLIRKQIVDRSEGFCERCGERITSDTGEMDEKISKGELGEVSVENCQFLCHDCHQKDTYSEHGERRWGGQKELWN